MKTAPVPVQLPHLVMMFLVSACQTAWPAATAGPSLRTLQTGVPAAARTPEAIPGGLRERSDQDRPDDLPGMYQVHLLYVLPADAADQQRDWDGRINQSVEAVNQWFFEQSGGSQIRFDTHQGQLDITFVPMDMTRAQFHAASRAEHGGAYWVRDVLEQRLETMALFQPGKVYLALFEIDRQPGACADAAHPPDLMGRLAGLYPSAVVEAGWNCAQYEFGAGSASADMVVIHEILHVLGFASSCGKNPAGSDNASHTGDFNHDLMWAPGADSTAEWDTARMQLDPGNDDYFRHGFPDCPDLANSAFLDPLPAHPETPPNWPAEWKLP